MKICLAVVAAAVVLLAVTAQADTTMTPDQAKKIADEINLTSADLIGYDVTLIQSTDFPMQNVTVARCAHALPRDDALAAVPSDLFTSSDEIGGVIVNSSVVVRHSAADAQRDAAAYLGRRGRACVQRLLSKATQEANPKFKVAAVSVSRLTLARVPGMRVKIVLASGKTRIASYSDGYLFVHGQAEIGLSLASVPRPFGAGKARRLLNLLMTRANQDVPDEQLAPGAPPGLPG